MRETPLIEAPREPRQELLFKIGRSGQIRGAAFRVRVSRVERVNTARGYRQAIVKVTSYGKGRRLVTQQLSYISRKGELELETDRGETLNTPEDQKALVDRWALDFDDRVNSRDSVHIVFSMPPGSSKDALKESVRATLGKQFPEHESVFALHEDQKHPHIHAIVKMRGEEGDKKLRLNKPELHKLRETFAQAAREQGVKLTATPRLARGVGRKAVQQAIYHMRKRGIRPDVDREAAREFHKSAGGHGAASKPWEKAIKDRTELERKTYRDSAQKLREKAEKESDPKLKFYLLSTASELERYSREMPEPKTREQAWKDRQKKTQEKQPQVKPPTKGRGAELER